MKVTVKSLVPPRKNGILAHASVEIELEGQRITMSDLRVLQNKSGELWVGMPSVAVQDGGKSYHYEPCVELGRELKRQVEDCVLDAYGTWAAQQKAVQS
jgi:DNA-binding cell septation regulator SpoVG